MTESKSDVAVCEAEDLARLEEALDIAKAESNSAGRLESTSGEAEMGSGADDAADLLATSRRGVNVAAHIESRPLIPLFQAVGVELPPEVKVDNEQMGYDFYLAELTFSVLLEGEEQLRSATFEIKLSDDNADRARKTRPVRLFPGRKDVELFRLEAEGAVGLDADLQLTVPHEAQAILPFAAAAVKVKAGIHTKMIAGPYAFHFRKAAIEVKGESDPVILWRYKLASELAGKNDFKSLLVLKVARETTRIDAAVTLGVVPFKRRWFLFENILPTLTMRAQMPIELVRRVK